MAVDTYLHELQSSPYLTINEFEVSLSTLSPIVVCYYGFVQSGLLISLSPGMSSIGGLLLPPLRDKCFFPGTEHYVMVVET